MGKYYQARKMLNEIVRFANDIESGKVVNDIVSKCAPLIIRDLDVIFTSSIDEYYKFKKRYYKRTYSFYKAYDISLNGNVITIHSGSDLIPKSHRVDAVDSDYIYNYMFVQGYHGGAASGEPDMQGSPFPGPMALRTPVPRYATEGMPPYSLWSRTKAHKDEESPQDKIDRNIEAYKNGDQNFSNKTLQDRFESAVNKVFRTYSIFR